MVSPSDPTYHDWLRNLWQKRAEPTDSYAYGTVPEPPADDAPIIEWVHYHISLGKRVFPAHAPLFDHPTGYRCTCEFYRHTERCKSNHSYLYLEEEDHCTGPGKCPAINWQKDAIDDPAQIQDWWGWTKPRYFVDHRTGHTYYSWMNIGSIAGDRTILDEDTYKETFAGHGLLTREDRETVTGLSGVGTHLEYRTPPGKTWGNATGELPAGIDIRCGDSGYVIEVGSLHHTGKRYTYEFGYAPHEIDMRPVPDWLIEILDAVQRKTADKDVRFSTADTERPDLSQWRLSGRILELIHTVAPKGERSEADMSVITALCYADATEDEILAVFEHYPIGLDGKYSERGQQYLAHSIGRARAYVEENPCNESLSSPEERAEFFEKLANTRAWIHTAEAAQTFRDAGMRVSTGTKCMDALCEICEEWGSPTVHPGNEGWALRAPVSPTTLEAAKEKFEAAGLIEVERSEEQFAADRVRLVFQNWGSSSTKPLYTTTPVLKNYAEYRCDDAFRNNHTAYKKDNLDKLSPLGETSLIVVCSLLDGDKTVKEIARERGLGEQTVRRALHSTDEKCDDCQACQACAERREAKNYQRCEDCRQCATCAKRGLVVYGLVSVATEHRNRKRYSLLPEWREAVEALRPNLTTYGVHEDRIEKCLERKLQAAKWSGDEGRIAKATEVYNRWMEHTSDRGPEGSPRLEWVPPDQEPNETPSQHWDGEDPAQWVRPSVRFRRPGQAVLKRDRAAEAEKRDALYRPLWDQRIDLAPMPEHERRHILCFTGWSNDDINAMKQWARQRYRTECEFVTMDNYSQPKAGQ